MFQSFNLIDELTVAENVEVALIYRGVSSAERKRRIAAALERVGLPHRARHLPQQLSGGQQQRVAVARALVAAPKLILADEPTGNLDTANGDAVMDMLTRDRQVRHHGRHGHPQPRPCRLRRTHRSSCSTARSCPDMQKLAA